MAERESSLAVLVNFENMARPGAKGRADFDIHLVLNRLAENGGVIAGLVNGAIIAYTRIPPFIATLGMMVSARGLSKWWSKGNPISFPTESFAEIGKGMNPVIIFILLAILFQLILTYTKYGKHCYAIGSNEEASRTVGIKVENHKMLVYTFWLAHWLPSQRWC